MQVVSDILSYIPIFRHSKAFLEIWDAIIDVLGAFIAYKFVLEINFIVREGPNAGKMDSPKHSPLILIGISMLI